MEKDAESIIADFNNIAARIYLATFDQFSDSSWKIKRNKDENVFKLQTAKYISMLKQRLEEQVEETLKACHSANVREQIKFQLSIQVNYYLQEFKHKSDAI